MVGAGPPARDHCGGRRARALDVTGYGAYLRQFFTSVRVVATLANPDGIHNQEWGGHVYVCTGPRHPWGQMWPRLRHYD